MLLDLLNKGKCLPINFPAHVPFLQCNIFLSVLTSTIAQI